MHYIFVHTYLLLMFSSRLTVKVKIFNFRIQQTNVPFFIPEHKFVICQKFSEQMKQKMVYQIASIQF